MKEWNELPKEVRDKYLDQDKVHKDVRVSYVSPDFLDNLSIHDVSSFRESELNEDDWTFLEKVKFTSRQKECLFAYVGEGKTQRVIGAGLGIPQQTVSFHIQAAKKKINKFMKKCRVNG